MAASIKLDLSKITEVKLALGGTPKAVERVLYRAINKTLTTVNSAAATEASSYYNIAQKNVKLDFTVSKAFLADLHGRWQSTSRPKSLTSFTGTRQTAKGVSVKILKEGQRIVLRHAFIATPKHISAAVREQGGGQQVFWRAYSGQRRPVKKNVKYGKLPETPYRYKIHRLTGPRMTDHLGAPEVVEKLITIGGERYLIVVDQELNYELSKLY